METISIFRDGKEISIEALVHLIVLGTFLVKTLTIKISKSRVSMEMNKLSMSIYKMR